MGLEVVGGLGLCFGAGFLFGRGSFVFGRGEGQSRNKRRTRIKGKRGGRELGFGGRENWSV